MLTISYIGLVEVVIRCLSIKHLPWKCSSLIHARTVGDLPIVHIIILELRIFFMGDLVVGGFAWGGEYAVTKPVVMGHGG